MANKFITPDEFVERCVEAARENLDEFNKAFEGNDCWEDMGDNRKAKCVVIMMAGGVIEGLNDAQ